MDDEPFNLIILRELLLKLKPDIEVHTASSGNQALQMINQRILSDSCYDLLITDNQMPGMSGIELIDVLRK